MYFVTKPWAAVSARDWEILFYMQTGTINCINWTFNFSQQYLGKVLVQYIHPSDMVSVVISEIFSGGDSYGTMPGIRCRPGSGKLWLIMRRRTRALFMGHMIQLLLHHSSHLSRSHWALPRISSPQLYRAAILSLIVNIIAARYQSWSSGNRNVLISASNLNTSTEIPTQDLSRTGFVPFLDTNVISGAQPKPLWNLPLSALHTSLVFEFH